MQRPLNSRFRGGDVTAVIANGVRTRRFKLTRRRGPMSRLSVTSPLPSCARLRSRSPATGSLHIMTARVGGGGTFGNCKNPGGPTDLNTIFDCAWNQVPASDKIQYLRD